MAKSPGVRSTTIDKTGGRGSGRSGGPGVKSREKDLTGGRQRPQGSPGVKTDEKDIAHKKPGGGK